MPSCPSCPIVETLDRWRQQRDALMADYGLICETLRRYHVWARENGYPRPLAPRGHNAAAERMEERLDAAGE